MSAGGLFAQLAAAIERGGDPLERARQRERVAAWIFDLFRGTPDVEHFYESPRQRIASAVVDGRIPLALVQQTAAKAIELLKRGELKCGLPRVYFVQTFQHRIFPRRGLDWSAPWGE